MTAIMPRKRPVPPTIHIDTNRKSAATSGEVLGERVKRSRRDRIFLTRWICGLLLLLAIVNAIPAVIQIYTDVGPLAVTTIPKWIYVQLFVALLHTIYAIFLWQIPDWSSLRSIACVLLVFAAWYGFVGASLLLAGGAGQVARFLELPFSLLQRAKIWCVAALLIELVGSYVAGIEAMNWKKMERIFLQISTADAIPTAVDRE